eukprot:COSAG04_NODE_19130_length_424_cov_0.704615_1_plen_64_part_10
MADYIEDLQPLVPEPKPDHPQKELAVGGAALLLVGALGFELGIDHEVADGGRGLRGEGWDSFKN